MTGTIEYSPDLLNLQYATPICKKTHFYRDGINNPAHFERPFLKLHYRRVVNTSSFRKDENRHFVWVFNVILKPPGHRKSIFDLSAFEPDVV